MLPSLERLVADAMRLAATTGGAGPELADLVNRFWRLVPDEDLTTTTAASMLAAVRDHLDLAAQRLPGEAKLRVRPAGDQADGDRTVLLVVTDDMPFLVDSVTAALAAAGLGLELLVHPLVVVRRAALGKLIQVLPHAEPDSLGTDPAAAGTLTESWMRIEVTGVVTNELVERVREVLGDVRVVVEDWARMRQRALDLAEEIEGRKLPVPARDVTDTVELLRWLAADHFTFIGYRDYLLRDAAQGQVLGAVLGSGLGILRWDPAGPRPLSSLSPEAYARALEKRLLTITKANSRSTVHRPAYLDYIGVKLFNEAGEVVGERRFLGLLSSAAYLTSVRDLPVVKRKVNDVLTRSGLSLRGHSGKDLLAVLEDYPREELFQISTDDLFRTCMGVLRLAGRRQVRVFTRKDHYGRFVSCLVYLPRDRFTTANRLRIQQILQHELRGIGLDYTTRVNESLLARVHVIVRLDPKVPHGQPDDEALSALVAAATRRWEDDFADTLRERVGDPAARALLQRYDQALPDTYKDAHTAHEAVQDLAILEMLEEPGDLQLHLFRRRKNDADVRFKVFRHDGSMTLSEVLPVLHSLGVKVTDERPYEIRRGADLLHIYDFGLSLPEGSHPDPAGPAPQASPDAIAIRSTVENAFAATWRGEAEVDHLNELVLRAGLTWRQVVILRAYVKYLRQAGTVYSQDYMESALATYPQVAAALVGLFTTRLDPAATHTSDEREKSATEQGHAIEAMLDAVTSLDHDRILRSLLGLVRATLRTSFFQHTSGGRPKSYVAVKLDPHAVADLPAPRPQFEIFVYSPRFEGVHLRFGPVARGGIRWSDRREDFRTEILGLVKAQMVKNTVIVPTGAKGGFVLKRPPTARDEFAAEGLSCYREFIAALLDVTDNIVDGAVVPPVDVVRHDGDDPYLVVAADKGTATFSDTANEIAARYGFWLDDAFASGGSAGYDHKAMAITARGAWESVQRHFSLLDPPIAGQPFTAVGVGDMSGDVFGNGMLRSHAMRLVAAFDHRHVFVDPDPDPARSFVERQRLFDLPRSSWDDYDRTLISTGGGVWRRDAKSVPISAPMRAALGIPDDVTALAPPELIRAILTAPVDLVWNGGIGTYVKGSDESNLEVGDKANDAVRVDGRDLRARVVAEGGNLGLTQAGRVEYALAGGRNYPDFIDNSAGVDCSDHEVNIKILLGARLPRPERDQLLFSMTDEIAALVLRDNYEQAATLAVSATQAGGLVSVHQRMMTELGLDRELEGLPTDAQLAARPGGLTTPELAVLLAHAKMAAERAVLASPLPDEEWTHTVLVDYFPTPLRSRFEAEMAGHRLRREIIATQLVNEAVNRGGISFVFRAVDETGASVPDILRAYIVIRDVFDLPSLWRSIEELDGVVPAAAQVQAHLHTRQVLDRAIRWLLTNRRGTIDVPGEIARLRPGVAALLPSLADLFQGRERAALADRVQSLVDAGLPASVADWSTRVHDGFGLLDVVEVADTTGRDVREVAGAYYLLSDRFGVDDLQAKISALPRRDRWETMARMTLRYDLYAALAELTTEVLNPRLDRTAPTPTAATPTASTPAASTPAASTPAALVHQWEQANAASIERTRNAIGAVDETTADLAPLSVLLRQIRTLVRASSR